MQGNSKWFTVMRHKKISKTFITWTAKYNCHVHRYTEWFPKTFSNLQEDCLRFHIYWLKITLDATKCYHKVFQSYVRNLQTVSEMAIAALVSVSKQKHIKTSSISSGKFTSRTILAFLCGVCIFSFISGCFLSWVSSLPHYQRQTYKIG